MSSNATNIPKIHAITLLSPNSPERWQPYSTLATLPGRVFQLRTGRPRVGMCCQRHSAHHHLRPQRLQSHEPSIYAARLESGVAGQSSDVAAESVAVRTRPVEFGQVSRMEIDRHERAAAVLVGNAESAFLCVHRSGEQVRNRGQAIANQYARTAVECGIVRISEAASREARFAHSCAVVRYLHRRHILFQPCGQTVCDS